MRLAHTVKSGDGTSIDLTGFAAYQDLASAREARLLVALSHVQNRFGVGCFQFDRHIVPGPQRF